MNVARILVTYLRLGILSELEYRANFFIQILESALGLAIGLGGLAVVFSHTDNLGGWLPGQLLALVGVHTLVGGMINLIIRPSMQKFMDDVRKGTLDFTLTKPADAQLLVSVQRLEMWKGVDIVLGAIVLGVAVGRLGRVISGSEAAFFLVALLCGAAIVYSFYLMLSTCAFWFVRVENILVIFQSMYSAGRWPVGIYPSGLRFALTFIVPIAFAVTVPAQGLTGLLQGTTMLGAAGLAVGLLLVSRLFWKFGIRYYSGASA
jgi:ABC-2 type transport system permease protein